MIEGIIFDMDGTMVDNMMVHHRAWQTKLRELCIAMSIEEVMEKVHGVNYEILERLFGDRFTHEERLQISKEKEQAYQKLFLPQLKLIDGLGDFLAAAKADGMPLAIGSAAPPENVSFVLDHLNLNHYFRAIYHSGNVSRGKPDPEVYQKAAQALGVPIEKCIVFEDSITGAATAKNAGCPTVIVTTTHAAEEFAHFDHILKFISDFTEFPYTSITG
ncbi:MAG: HAD family phosphatase [Bacteroidota bacterium]